MRELRAIILDVDGVLADFFGAALRAHGSEHLADNWPAGHWEMMDVMGLGHNAFWEPLDNFAFWDSCQLYPGAQDFVNSLGALGDVYFATIPSTSAESTAAKVRWLHRHFPDHTGMVGKPKWLLAHPEHLLIDDSDKNCDEFAHHGGMVWQYPRRWNRLHAQDPMDYDTALRCITAYLRLDGSLSATWLAEQDRKGDE